MASCLVANIVDICSVGHSLENKSPRQETVVEMTDEEWTQSSTLHSRLGTFYTLCSGIYSQHKYVCGININICICINVRSGMEVWVEIRMGDIARQMVNFLG